MTTVAQPHTFVKAGTTVADPVVGSVSGLRTTVRKARLAVGLALIGLQAVACTGGHQGSSPAPPSSTRPLQVVPIGNKVVIDDGNTVQVANYDGNASPSNEFSRPQPGKHFAAIDVEACAGSRGSADGVVNPFFFTLLLADNTSVQTSIPVKDPGLSVGPNQPGDCIRGFVTYEVPQDAKVTAVVFEARGWTVRWTLP